MQAINHALPDERLFRPGYLYLGFAVYMLAFMAFAYYAYSQFSTASQYLSEQIKTNDTQLNAAMRMRVAVRERAILLWQMSIQSDPFVRDELFLKFREYGSRYQLARQEYIDTNLDAEEQTLIRELDTQTSMRAPMLREFSQALLEDVGLEVYTPMLNQTLTNQIVVANILDEMIYMQKSHNSLAHEENKERITNYLYQLIGVASFILLSGSLFSWGVVRSIHKQRHQLIKANEKLDQMARYDTLTKLHNRMSLMEHLELNFALAMRHRQLGALLFIDLDGFKAINDNCGHEIGDRFLMQIADNMRQLRDCDIVARLGGDEFVVVLLNLVSEDSAYIVADKLLEKLSASYVFDGHQVSASASIGICFFPGENDSVDKLLSCADTAMYEAKNRGKNRYVVGF